MRIFLAGATGAVGRPLVRQLLAAGHDVVGLTRSPAYGEALAALGVQPAVGDVYETESLTDAVLAAQPEVVMHQLTALPRKLHPRRIRRETAATNRLRTAGTENLLAAAKAAGARRFVAQSLAFVYDPAGEGLAVEDEPLWRKPPRSAVDLVAALDRQRALVEQSGLEGVVLRYGSFYGPHTYYDRDAAIPAEAQRRRLPVVGGGAGVFSFIHVEDAASAAVAALTGPPGVYNIVDDDPAPANDWIPLLAKLLGARPPMRVPRWLGRLGAGAYGVFLMCEQRGASNAKAKEQLGWTPSIPSWRDGFAAELSDPDRGAGN